MKFQLDGKVLERSVRALKKKDGTPYDLYTVIIEEVGLKFNSIFKVTTQDPSLFGPADGFAAVGKFVHVTGYVDGRPREVSSADKKFTMYDVYLKANSASELSYEAKPIEPVESDPSDIPF